MADISTLKQYEFPYPNEDKGYNIFPTVLEDDPLIAFHGTAELNLASIVKNGFKIQGNLSSVSFAKGSSLSLRYACEKRSAASPKGVILAVRFGSLNPPCVVEEFSIIYLYCENQQPEIVGYCIVPDNYEYR